MHPTKPSSRVQGGAILAVPSAGPCPVAGIGASAGGLAALTRFFDSMPADGGIAFVLVQHLDPNRASLTAELLARHTRMPVVQVARDTAIEANRVYVIPPNRYLSIEEGTLRVRPPAERCAVRMPVDFLLRSLAEERGERAIGIVLSGTGTDGTLGLREIRAAGGLTIAQDPATAEHDGMPRSAIDSGVDHVLPVEGMPEALLRYVRHPYAAGAPAPATPEEAENHLGSILAILRTRARFDFRAYKRATLQRRIQRRMSLRHVEGMPEYLRLLRGDPAELAALRKDLLISVTRFFRDPKGWAAVQKEVIPRLLERKAPGELVRAWVPGCATGEEAYTVAMLLIEGMHAAEKSCPIQIFASDVDPDALEVARAGVYSESIESEIEPERLRRFFAKQEHGYRVSKEMRECVVFAQQNLLADPPFSRLDLVSCRNLLMYLEPTAQNRALTLLHFSLVEGRYLFLGTAETIGVQDDLFEVVSKKWRLYRRIGPTRHDRVAFPVAAASEPSSAAEPRPPGVPSAGRFPSLVQQVLLDRFAPASVVVNRKGEILYFCGPTHDYLAQPTGLPANDLLAQARPGLQSKLRGALHRAIRDDRVVAARGVRVRRGTAFHRVEFTVEPLRAPPETEGLLLVSFRDEREGPQAPVPPTAAEESVVQQLEHELKGARDDLQSTTEEFETANEELNAANEEVTSVNEELQSTNEELETSKEELQSLNEELNTVNAQLEAKVEQLERVNNDLANLLSSTDIPTVFLDAGFRLRRFTPAATRLFNLLPSDLGRPIADIAPKFSDPDFLAEARGVLDRLAPATKEVRTSEGRWFMRQILPYRTQDDRIDGVVVTFSNVAAEVLEDARRNAEAIVDTVWEALAVLDGDLRVRSANRSFYTLFHLTPEETEGRLLPEIGKGEWDVPDLRTRLGKVLPDEERIEDLEIERDFERIGRRILRLNARALARDERHPGLILLGIEDVTERNRHEAALRESEGRTRAILDTAAEGIVTVDEQGAILSFNPAAERIFGHAAGEVVGRSVYTLIPPPERGEGEGSAAAWLVGGGREVVGRRKDGTTFPLDLAVGESRQAGERLLTGIVRDLTERRRFEEEARSRRAELARVHRVGMMGEFATGLAHELAQPLSAIANSVEACVRQLRRSKAEPRALFAMLRQAGLETQRAGKIMRRMQDFVRRHAPRFEAADLRGIVERVGKGMAGEAREKSIRLRFDLDERPLPVRVDPIQVEQVLVNLLQNAIDAVSEAGRRRREIELRASVTGEGMAEVAVRDTGTGFSDAVAQHIFDPFFTTKKEGLGMGLAISRTFVEAHGGRLWVAPGEHGKHGTTVRLALPLRGAGVGAHGRRPPPARGERGKQGVTVRPAPPLRGASPEPSARPR
ncbi:MAG TPA: chemotaxis protein CheB [Planctomycetota bacterium]|nr:chemotaxis protein CheB [Planctomycetota bacterium]